MDDTENIFKKKLLLRRLWDWNDSTMDRELASVHATDSGSISH